MYLRSKVLSHIHIHILFVILSCMFVPKIMNGQCKHLNISAHSSLYLSNHRADEILAEASDVCGTVLTRKGNVTTFLSGDGSVDTKAEYDELTEKLGPGEVMVVREINWCGVPGVCMCAPIPGNGFLVARHDASKEGELWAHLIEHGVSGANNHSSSKNVDCFVKRASYDGIRWDRASEFKSANDQLKLIALLFDPKSNAFRTSVVMTLALSGSKLAVGPILQVLKNGEGQLNDDEYCTKRAAMLALGILANRTGDKRPIEFLKKCATNPARAGKDLKWSLPYGFDESYKQDRIATMAIWGLALSASKDAIGLLKKMKAKARKRSQSIASDRNNLISEALALAEEFYQTRDIVKFYQQKRATHLEFVKKQIQPLGRIERYDGNGLQHDLVVLHSSATKQHHQNVINAVNSLPNQIVNLLKDNGISVVAINRLDYAKIDGTPQSGRKWSEVPAALVKSKILLASHYTVKARPTPVRDLLGNLLHEIGHAFDHVRRLSQYKDFIKAYDIDKRCRTNTRVSDRMRHFVQRSEKVGRSEVFAEGFAIQLRKVLGVNHKSSIADHRAKEFRQWFPKATDCVASIVTDLIPAPFDLPVPKLPATDNIPLPPDPESIIGKWLEPHGQMKSWQTSGLTVRWNPLTKKTELWSIGDQNAMDSKGKNGPFLYRFDPDTARLLDPKPIRIETIGHQTNLDFEAIVLDPQSNETNSECRFFAVTEGDIPLIVQINVSLSTANAGQNKQQATHARISRAVRIEQKDVDKLPPNKRWEGLAMNADGTRFYLACENIKTKVGARLYTIERTAFDDSVRQKSSVKPKVLNLKTKDRFEGFSFLPERPKSDSSRFPAISGLAFVQRNDRGLLVAIARDANMVVVVDVNSGQVKEVASLTLRAPGGIEADWMSPEGITVFNDRYWLINDPAMDDKKRNRYVPLQPSKQDDPRFERQVPMIFHPDLHAILKSL